MTILDHDEDIGYFENRINELNKLLAEESIDIDRLRSISHQRYGFINRELRSKIWAKLLLIDDYSFYDYEDYDTPPRDHTQVSMDVDRSLWNIDVAMVNDDSILRYCIIMTIGIIIAYV